MEKKVSQSNIQNVRSASNQEFKSISAQLTDLKDYLNNIIEEQGDNEEITADSAEATIEATITILELYNGNCSIDSIKEVCEKALLKIDDLKHNNKMFGSKEKFSSQDYVEILKSVITKIDEQLPYAKAIDILVNSINKTPFIQLTDLKDNLNNIIKEQGANKEISPDSAEATIKILELYNGNCSINSIKEVCGKAWLDIYYLMHNNKTFGAKVNFSSQKYFKILESVITEIDKELPYAKLIDIFVNKINSPSMNENLKKALIEHAVEITAILARDMGLKYNSKADREPLDSQEKI